MPKYNLDALGPQEFECLSQSLVQQIIGPGAKVYGMGKDGAREATFTGRAPYPSDKEQWDGSWIFQAKFHDVQQIGPVEARRQLLVDIGEELFKITEKYQHPCDNFILMTNVTLTPVYQTGTRDLLDKKIISKYSCKIKNIDVWGADEICRFLDANPGIRQTYANFLVSGDIIGRLLGILEQKETDLDELVKLYCQGCSDNEKYAILDDAGDIEEKRVELPWIFIDLDGKAPILSKDPQILETLPNWLKQATENENRKSALSYLFDDSIPGLVLIGGPGSGKSTLGQYLAHIHRTRLLGRLGEIEEDVESLDRFTLRVPFRVALREYAQWITTRRNSESLANYLSTLVSRISGRSVTTEEIHKILKTNPSILILDGLDEVAERSLRTKVLDNITQFINQVREVLGGNIRIVATTRPYGYSEEFDPKHYLHLTLETLPSEKALLYTERWIKAREPIPEEAERIKTTFNICLKDKVVNVLTSTPLQVTILLVIIRARGTPPKQSEELFAQYMDTIYVREQKRRPELLRTEKDKIYGLHKYLAYILHKRAEKDETAALIDMSDFKEKVLEYLLHCDPILNEEEEELKEMMDQIIAEVGQRLVLIESPQEGKIGFGLTSIREFFTAAHLVDSAKTTQERDARFKAIARLPHWRNVALFFAGRIGRIYIGEAPSLIDVCRDIDTERADKFLRRGAELTLEVVDDRALREPHNEVGAIQYGLSLFDSEFVRDREGLFKKIKAFPDRYKKRIVLPWLEEKFNKVIPTNLESYMSIYRELFGVREPLLAAIKRAAEYDSKEVKLLALGEAVRSKTIEAWVMDLMDELVDTLPLEEIAWELFDCWPNLSLYLQYPRPNGIKIAIVMILPLLMRNFPHGEPSEDMKKIFKLRPEGKYKKNLFPLWAVIQLFTIYPREEMNRHKGRRISFYLPAILCPKVRAKVSKNADFINEFCQTFSEEKEPLIISLVTLLGYLMEPHDLKKYINVYEMLQSLPKKGLLYSWLSEIVPQIIGAFPQDREKLYTWHHELSVLYKHYKSENQFELETEELIELVSEKSKDVSNHPYRLFVWIKNECDPSIEKFLDSVILGKIKKWLGTRDLSVNSLCHFSWHQEIKNDLESVKFAIEIVNNSLLEGEKQLRIQPMSTYYDFHDPKTKLESEIANQIKNIVEKALAKYKTSDETILYQLEILYWAALCAGVIEEKHMLKFANLFHNILNFPSRLWYVGQVAQAQKILMNMIQSKNSDIASLATVSLYGFLQNRFFLGEQKRVKETWVGDKYWQFAKNKNDIWHLIYIRGMAYCPLKWAKNGKEWFEEIKKSDTEELQYAWYQVIEKSYYSNIKDRDALYEILLQILESGKAFTKFIRIAALQRLHIIVREVESIGFEEKPLNLPLPQRAKIC